MESAKQKKDGKIGFLTGVAYGSGDMACSIVFGMISSLLVLFYTDYVGVSAALVGTVMLISRLFDGVSDFIMGWIVSKTKSKYGQSRPWIIRMAVPFCVCSVLLFTVPRTSTVLTVMYIFITYNLVNTVCYTAINLPYGSLSVMMTRDVHEREKLGAYRMAISPFGRIIAVSCSLPLIKLLGDNQRAWIMVMGLWSALALLLLIFCFVRCKETVEIKNRDEMSDIPLGKNVKALVVNPYFWSGAILWALEGMSYTVSGTMLPYYCKYIFGNDALYSPLYMIEQIVGIVVVMGCPFYAKYLAKNKLIIIGAVTVIVGQLLVLLNPASYQLCLLSCVTRAVGLSPLNGYVFVMIGDAVEYGEWKTHIRQESFVFAAGSVGAKVGMGLASAGLSGMMSAAGYVSSAGQAVTQPESAIASIRNLYIWAPVVIFALVIVVCALYKLDKMYPMIMKELSERESAKQKEDEDAYLENIEKDPEVTKNHVVITINRQYGSGGREIAKILAKKMEVPFYDREIVYKAAKEMENSVDIDKSYQTPEDQARGKDDWTYDIVPYYNKMYQQQSVTILKMAQKGSAVFLGRCADAILKDFPHHYSFFVYADDEFRKERSPQFYDGMSFKDMEKEEQTRERYYHYYTGRKWGALENYHLMINTSCIEIEDAADLILDYVKMHEKEQNE